MSVKAYAQGAGERARSRVNERKREAEEELEEWRENRDAHEAAAQELARRELEGSVAGRLLLNSPQAVVQTAIAIMALLMIGVVILGKIDNFTPSLDGTWQNTSENISKQAGETFGFLNLVPFIIVALFVLGLMAARM